MQIFDFGKGIPDCIKADGGKLSVTKLMVKQGTASLRWDFKRGDKLIFNTDIGYCHLVPDGKDFRVYVFGMYMFGFGDDGSLGVAFCKDGIVKSSFDAELGFSGWRSVTACFERDMDGIPCEGMNSMVFTAKADGSLLFSEIITANRVDQRHILKSYQVPFIKNNEFIVEKNWKVNSKYTNVKYSFDEVEAIKQRALLYIKTEYADKCTMTYDDIEKSASQFEISENELGITGKRVEWYNQRRIVDQTELKDDVFVSLRTVTNLMLDIAAYYMHTNDARAAKIYITILKYIIIQGFAEGSSFGTHKILDYGIRPFYTSAMAMHKVIEENGLTDDVCSAMLWFLHACQRGFAEGIEIKKASSDDFFNSGRGLIFAILMLKDENKKASLLAAFSDWVSQSLEYRPGLCGMFKEDGSIFHHHGHYISYAKGGMSGLTPIVWFLSGTSFEIKDNAYENLKNVLFAMHFQCNGREVPIALSGRHPTGEESIDSVVYKYFALSALEKGDTKSAGLYLNLADGSGDTLDKEIFSKALKNVNSSGNRSFPYACCSVHKRPHFMAVAKGYSKYLWGSEIYLADNLYGRYRSYGVLELINGKSPFSHNGYDWRRFPGSTAICVPMEDMKANVLNVDDKSGFEEMLLSDKSFAGSVSLGDNGMFSMILSSHPKYCATHTAHKSIFFHNNFILLLGSGISNDSPFETETTLYQISRDIFPDKPNINGKEFCGQYRIKENDVLTDSCGNKFYLKSGTSIFLSCGKQKSYHSENCSETYGDFATAVINHGISPSNSSYEYGIAVAGSEKENYTVIRSDNSLHAVKIGNTTYMAVFEVQSCELVEVNVPVLVMIQETEDLIKLAICNPDLALYETDDSQYDENGVQKEVSIYSRSWLSNHVGSKKVKLSLPFLNISVTSEIKGGSIFNTEFKKL